MRFLESDHIQIQAADGEPCESKEAQPSVAISKQCGTVAATICQQEKHGDSQDCEEQTQTRDEKPMRGKTGKGLREWVLCREAYNREDGKSCR
jgi:hypothetical protein